MQNGEWLQQTDLFVSGVGGYHTHRIPALVVSLKGTILAFCEGRKYSGSDSGKIDILLRRSFDQGETWEDARVVAADGEDVTCGNPCPAVDRRDGTVWMPFCKNLADGPESMIVAGKAPRTVWVTRSADDGATWAEPEEITEDVKRPSWTWYATGPGHGIQLKSGRLLIPCDHIVGRDFRQGDPYHSHVVYSDDGGGSWRIGGVVDEGTNECAVVQTLDGSVYLNARNYRGSRRRTCAWSRDNGDSFTGSTRDDALFEPICQAGLARFTDQERHDRNRIVFSNPASIQGMKGADGPPPEAGGRIGSSPRERMTVRVSYDECGSWGNSRLLYEGKSAYSDLAIARDMKICCFYERGEETPYERLTLARFNIEWLTRGADRLGE